jgi:hypothetical protein
MAHAVTCASCCEVVFSFPESLHYRQLEGFEANCDNCGQGSCTWSPVDHGAVAVFTPYHQVCDADCGKCEECTLADVAMSVARMSASIGALCKQDPTELDPDQAPPVEIYDEDSHEEPTLPSVQDFWEPVPTAATIVNVHKNGRVTLEEASSW